MAACDKFVFTEILRPLAKGPAPPAVVGQAEALRLALLQAVAAVARDEGWAPLSTVGGQLNKADPSFDPRNFGFSKLGDLVKAQAYVEVKSVPARDGSPNVHLYVRRRDAG